MKLKKAFPTAAEWRWFDRICRRLDIDDPRNIEIESKRRLLPEEAGDVRRYLKKRTRPGNVKTTIFFDQFLDTPKLDILRAGASLRLRYKGNGSKVYLQYKGRGFLHEGVLYRSEFTSGELRDILLEESHHDVVHFTETTVRGIIRNQIDPGMADALRAHLGDRVLARVTNGPIICTYRKDKFLIDLGKGFLEPSVDQVFAFETATQSHTGLHSLSAFCEYENEIKSDGENLLFKLKHIPDLLDFDRKLAKHFNMPPERLDKYHRCASCFLPKRAA
ncbi:CYTH domain-containing protein [bacterium]|nr:CYTH domain-containing protein [bacterium]